ncbi:hypothetical protein MUK42_12874 [Musa troglodytarum]|uniref:Uncharacterized protein n=1 Tax=Musa troglodytarum TaxID=320322 RepID=A0A9E7GHE9_9LILI|nr:hypothetical protein MUK42_12874 [Musa troglodytarum]
MARFLLLALVLASALLFLSFPAGLGRRVHVMRHFETWNSPAALDTEETRLGRKMMETEMDYPDPRANTNPRNGPLFDTLTPPPVH